jgi:hypothetical protein
MYIYIYIYSYIYIYDAGSFWPGILQVDTAMPCNRAGVGVEASAY